MAYKVKTKNAYKKEIIQQMKELCIYQQQYEILIDILAETCHMRDKNMQEWLDPELGKGLNTMLYTNKAGATNLSRSPYYLNNLQFQEQILKYCKELCLSPSGINKLGHPNEGATDEFDEFLNEIS